MTGRLDRFGPLACGATLLAVLATVVLAIIPTGAAVLPSSPSAMGPGAAHAQFGAERSRALTPSATANATGNLSAVLNRAVVLVGIAASGVVTLVWSRVAISWFSHDPTKKVQAKERARDALVGSMVLLAAVSGLAWGLAHWVLTGA